MVPDTPPASVVFRSAKERSVAEQQATWDRGMRPREGEASAVNMIAIIVGHVSYVPVLSVAQCEGQPGGDVVDSSRWRCRRVVAAKKLKKRKREESPICVS